MEVTTHENKVQSNSISYVVPNTLLTMSLGQSVANTIPGMGGGAEEHRVCILPPEGKSIILADERLDVVISSLRFRCSDYLKLAKDIGYCLLWLILLCFELAFHVAQAGLKFAL